MICVMSGMRETVGSLIGRAWSAPVALVSALRHARMFHPRGVVFEAEVTALAPMGERLAGHALARFSGALFKAEVERFEVLGLALRFSREVPRTATPAPEDQDLLLATIISPFTMPLSPFTTRSDDFLANKYWAVSPFVVDGAERVKFRATPEHASPDTVSGREDKLAVAVAQSGARLTLEARRTLRTGWTKIATIALTASSDVDQEALRFDPFRSGRGIVPAGLVHAIRRDVYSAGQKARPHSSGAERTDRPVSW